MTETTATLMGETDAALDWDLIEDRCAELGAVTSNDRAVLLGISRASMYRWKAGGPITLDTAAKIAQRIGRTLPQILAEPRPTSPKPGPRPPAGPENPRPPAGPKADQ